MKALAWLTCIAVFGASGCLSGASYPPNVAAPDEGDGDAAILDDAGAGPVVDAGECVTFGCPPTIAATISAGQLFSVTLDTQYLYYTVRSNQNGVSYPIERVPLSGGSVQRGPLSSGVVFPRAEEGMFYGTGMTSSTTSSIGVVSASFAGDAITEMVALPTGAILRSFGSDTDNIYYVLSERNPNAILFRSSSVHKVPRAGGPSQVVLAGNLPTGFNEEIGIFGIGVNAQRVYALRQAGNFTGVKSIISADKNGGNVVEVPIAGIPWYRSLQWSEPAVFSRTDAFIVVGDQFPPDPMTIRRLYRVSLATGDATEIYSYTGWLRAGYVDTQNIYLIRSQWTANGTLYVHAAQQELLRMPITGGTPVSMYSSLRFPEGDWPSMMAGDGTSLYVCDDSRVLRFYK